MSMGMVFSGKKNKIRVAVLAAVLFLASSMVSYSSICCMFAASRHYGWPYPFVNVTKTVETMAEAQQVDSEMFFELYRNGWRPYFAADFTRGTGSAVLNLLIDLGLSLILAGVIMKVWSGYRGYLDKCEKK